MPTIAGFFKMKYCRGVSLECARYQARQLVGCVPADLFPDQHHRLPALLQAKRQEEVSKPSPSRSPSRSSSLRP